MSYKRFRPQRVNANRHTQKGLSLLDDSIRGDGWIGAITVAADGETFDGSARLERVADVMPSANPIIVESDGTRPIFVVRTDIPNADDPRAKRLGVAANSIAVQDYNPDGMILAMLAAEDERIKAQIANDDKAIRAVLEAANEARGEGDAEPQIDRAAELNEKWKVKPGDLWAIGDHRLLCGDSTRREDVEGVMGGERADMWFADPPYNAGVDEWDNDFEWNHDFVLDFARFGIVTPGIVSIQDFFKKTTMPYKWTLAVYIDNGYARGAVGFNWFNNAFIFSKESVFKQKPDAIKISLVNGEANGNYHRGQKPPKFMEWVVGLYGESIVLDTFAGSGTTLVACQNLSRQCRAIEISPAYCSVILQRMTDAFPGIDIHRIEA